MQHPPPSLLCGLILLMLPRLTFSAGPAECFNLDGSASLDHAPCIPASSRSDTNHSACCVLGQPVGNKNDICTSQGLCYSQGSINSLGFLYQGGCTDASLKDQACRFPCAPNGKFLTLNYTHYLLYGGISESSLLTECRR